MITDRHGGVYPARERGNIGGGRLSRMRLAGARRRMRADGPPGSSGGAW
jgi:hypothetical protein